MHVTRCSLLLGAVLNLTLSTQLSADNLPSTVSLATHNLHPYGSYQRDGEFSGVAYDAVACVLKGLGVKLKLKVVPWNRAQYEAKNGSVDGFFAGSQNAERDRYAKKTDIIADQKWQWYQLKDNPLQPDSAGFKENAIVSSFLGANMHKWLIENRYKTSPPPRTTELLSNMLMHQKIDAALANHYVMDAIIEKQGLSNKVRKQLLKDKPLYLYLNNAFVEKYSAFIDNFNALIPSCRSQ